MRRPYRDREQRAARMREMNRARRGDLNPAKRPEVRAKISAALRGVRRSSRSSHWNWKGFRDPQEKKVCECGCGTQINRWKRGAKGTVRAVENRFAVGHQGRGKRRPDFAENVRKANRLRVGALNPATRQDVRTKISATMSGRIPQRILHLMAAKVQRAIETSLCECGCGTVIRKWNSGDSTRLNRFALGHHNRGRKRPVEVGAKISAALRGVSRPSISGDKHWNWKGGISTQEHLERNSPRYHAWRDAVYRRDGWTCVICSTKCRKGNIAADHIVPWDESEALRYEVSNGRTLCRRCHGIRHGLGVGVRP